MTELKMTEEELLVNLRLLEAVLFTSSELVTVKQLAEFFTPEMDIELLLEHLQQQYTNRGVNLVKRGNAWGLRTAPDLAEKLEVIKVETRPMSRAAIETLAIIAYHQPVTRAEIEQIRGVSISKSTFEILVAENLIKPGKRRDVVGRPLTWITTRHFLDTFSLESLKELPNLLELKEAGLLSMVPPQISEQHTLPMPEFTENEEELAEGDADTDFDEESFVVADDENDDDTHNTGEAA